MDDEDAGPCVTPGASVRVEACKDVADAAADAVADADTADE